ncbi:hypothetical protein M422DRAFT_247162 [Sphaerobolus stellatus SS14]|nr:hypothetical protein M422DRAFT_247162 [Sphaerobolus stellatus SS14]
MPAKWGPEAQPAEWSNECNNSDDDFIDMANKQGSPESHEPNPEEDLTCTGTHTLVGQKNAHSDEFQTDPELNTVSMPDTNSVTLTSLFPICFNLEDLMDVPPPTLQFLPTIFHELTTSPASIIFDTTHSEESEFFGEAEIMPVGPEKSLLP